MTRLEKFEAAFKQQFPKAWYRVDDFFGEGEIVFWTGEDCYDNNGYPLYDYYSDDESLYDFGVHHDLVDLAKEHGFVFESYDAGTIIAYDL